jgi:peptidoglycan/LPS O-acetylase OafA/YrhL
MKRTTILIWMSSLLLGANHLLFLAGNDRQPGFWIWTSALLACYSLPFLGLLMMRIPQNPSVERYMILTVFILVFVISIFLPTRRFLPGYRPAELEGVAYLLFPLFEGALIIVAQVGYVIIRILRKDNFRV